MSRRYKHDQEALDVLCRQMIRETEEFLARHLRQTEPPPAGLRDSLIPAIDRSPRTDR